MPQFLVTTTTATLVASTPYSAIELRTASEPPVKIVKWWVDFNSTTSTDKPCLVQAGRFTAAVTANSAGTASPLSWVGNDNSAVTAVGVNATTEGAGTTTGSVEGHYVLPQGGLYVGWETDDTALWIAPSSYFRIRITPGSALTTTTANVGVVFVE